MVPTLKIQEMTCLNILIVGEIEKEIVVGKAVCENMSGICLETDLHEKLYVHVLGLRSLPEPGLGLTHRLDALIETL